MIGCVSVGFVCYERPSPFGVGNLCLCQIRTAEAASRRFYADSAISFPSARLGLQKLNKSLDIFWTAN
jgi:hypothetical protein